MAESRKAPGLRAATYAKRFAAKEACAKALGTGFGRVMAMKEIGVAHGSLGEPILALTGGAQERLEEILPDHSQQALHVSLSDDPPYAQAFVVIEAIPSGHG